MLGPGVTVTSTEAERLEVAGLGANEIGELAAAHGIVLHELTPLQPSLEEAFMELTREDVEFRAGEVAAEDRAEVAA